MNGIKAPCKNCPDRELGCHGKCEKYQEYRTKVNEYNKKKHDAEFKAYLGTLSLHRPKYVRKLRGQKF